MTTRTATCTNRRRGQSEDCGGEIRPSYIGLPPSNGVTTPKGEIAYPATCQTCGATYPDVISFALTSAELNMVRDRLSRSTRDELAATATELPDGGYDIEIAEDRATDLASKAANLGLLTIAAKLRQELSGLALERRAPPPRRSARRPSLR